MINLKNKDFSICLLRQSTCFTHECNFVNSQKDFTCLSGKLRTEISSLSSQNPLALHDEYCIVTDTKAQTNTITVACGLVFSHLIGIALQHNDIWEIFLV